MAIQPGERLPAATFAILRDGVQRLTTDDVFKGKKVVLFAVPGSVAAQLTRQESGVRRISSAL